MNIDDYLVGSLLFFIYYGFPLIMLALALVLLQTRTLSQRLDSHLFNENYFTVQEMSMLSSFPLSLLKTLAYIRLITFPNSLRKRFGDTTARDKISTFAATLSHITMALVILNTVIILNSFIAITLNYLLLDVFDTASL